VVRVLLEYQVGRRRKWTDGAVRMNCYDPRVPLYDRDKDASCSWLRRRTVCDAASIHANPSVGGGIASKTRHVRKEVATEIKMLSVFAKLNIEQPYLNKKLR